MIILVGFVNYSIVFTSRMVYPTRRCKLRSIRSTYCGYVVDNLYALQKLGKKRANWRAVGLLGQSNTLTPSPSPTGWGEIRYLSRLFTSFAFEWFPPPFDYSFLIRGRFTLSPPLSPPFVSFAYLRFSTGQAEACPTFTSFVPFVLNILNPQSSITNHQSSIPNPKIGHILVPNWRAIGILEHLCQASRFAIVIAAPLAPRARAHF